jgi:hypothetical protein
MCGPVYAVRWRAGTGPLGIMSYRCREVLCDGVGNLTDWLSAGIDLVRISGHNCSKRIVFVSG